MKRKMYLLVMSLSLIGYSQAQTNFFPDDGNVGIGTTSPSRKLEVRGSVRVHGNQYSNRISQSGATYMELAQRDWGAGGALLFNAYAADTFVDGGLPVMGNTKHMFNAQTLGAPSQGPGMIYFGGNSGVMQFFISPVSSGAHTDVSWGAPILHLTRNRRVGIGTSSPSHNLHVVGSGKWTGNESSYTEISSNSYGQFIRQYANDGTTVSWLIRGYATNGVQALFNNGGINVNGVVRAKEVNLTASGWPDYVFEAGYNPMDLLELEAYLQENRHLPGIPSEAEVGQNGVNIGELNTALLKKVEELTLYTIKQEKAIRLLLQKMEEMERRLTE